MLRQLRFKIKERKRKRVKQDETKQNVVKNSINA